MKNHRIPLKQNPYRTIPDKKARQFAADFAVQVPASAKQNLGSMTEPLRCIVTVYYPSWRQDLDCALVYDLLQKHGVVANDRFIREKHEYAAIDQWAPRVEITVEEL